MQCSAIVEGYVMSINRFWVEPHPHDGWIVKREDPIEIYRYADRGAAEIFARALAQRYRPSIVTVRQKSGRIENEWTYPVFDR